MKMSDAVWVIQHRKAELKTFTDKMILEGVIQPEDMDAPFTNGNDTYINWMLIGRVFQPKRIAEIGTRFGYSLWSMWLGASHIKSDMEFWVTDNESDHYPTLDRFEQKFREWGFQHIHIDRRDSQTLQTLSLHRGMDLVSVDGLHSERGVMHDLGLALHATKPGGVIVVDDTITGGEVGRGCDRFCIERNLESAYLPCKLGMTLIRVPGGT